MNYTVDNAIAILSRTPRALRELLGGLPADWVEANEGPGTWGPFDIVGHLLHGEHTDWIARAEIILGPSPDKRFEPFVCDGMVEFTGGKTLDGLLAEFGSVREANVRKLKAFGLDDRKLAMTGIHPEFGEVTLRQHLATWVAHDLAHVAQAARVLAKQYKGEVGPWTQYLSILK
jgi:hypothetical protein